MGGVSNQGEIYGGVFARYLVYEGCGDVVVVEDESMLCQVVYCAQGRSVYLGML